MPCYEFRTELKPSADGNPDDKGGIVNCIVCWICYWFYCTAFLRVFEKESLPTRFLKFGVSSYASGSFKGGSVTRSVLLFSSFTSCEG